MKKLTIIGAGIGNPNLLTSEAIELISTHKNIYISEERFSHFKEINRRIKIISYSKLEETIASSEKDIAIIVTGDFGFFSIAKTLSRIFSQTKEIELISGISSMQYLASRLGMVYHDWITLSLHGSNINKLLGYVTYNEKVFIITGGHYGVKEVCEILLDAGFYDLNIFVGQNLSYDTEKIFSITLQEALQLDFDELNVMLIENPNFCIKEQILKQSDFFSSKFPVNDTILRSSIISKLELKPSDVVYNIGAYSGDITTDIAKKCYNSIVYAFDENEDCFKNMEKNKAITRCFNIFNFNQKTPPDFENPNLLIPNKVLLSSSCSNYLEIFNWILTLTPVCKFVIHTSFLSNITDVLNCFKQFNATAEVSSISLNTIKDINNNSLFFAQNPVFLISGDIDLTQNI